MLWEKIYFVQRSIKMSINYIPARGIKTAGAVQTGLYTRLIAVLSVMPTTRGTVMLALPTICLKISRVERMCKYTGNCVIIIA